MDFKTALEILDKAKNCEAEGEKEPSKCDNALLEDCQRCEYYVEENTEIDAREVAHKALKYCVEHDFEPITNEQVIDAAKMLQKYCKQHSIECSRCALYREGKCKVNDIPECYELEE